MARDYYDILGVTDSASAADIKKAFRTLAKKYHPDRNKGDAEAEKRFKEISEAYETLSDDKKRREYDTMKKYGAFAGGGPGGPGGAGFGGFQQGAHFDFSDLFGGGGPGGRRTHFRTGGAGMGGFEDLFSSIFGGAPGGANPFGQTTGRPRPEGVKRGADLHTSLTISFMEAVRGTERTIQLREFGKKLAVKIPAGIEDGGKIRLRGQGHFGDYGGSNGDLIITVNVMP
ncbi:DnaJ domain-containing protein, partial [candidate division GN15 bacterium]|nr:DnaJ domain-containing protein [candidate division GN15 bacterium]